MAKPAPIAPRRMSSVGTAAAVLAVWKRTSGSAPPPWAPTVANMGPCFSFDSRKPPYWPTTLFASAICAARFASVPSESARRRMRSTRESTTFSGQ